jgi:4-hydroxyphenylpyruvate dioxygenase
MAHLRSPTILTSNGTTLPLYGGSDHQAPDYRRRRSSISTSSHSDSDSGSDSFVSTTTPSYHGYHHITWWVGNAKQAASYYISRMGFRPLAHSGLETGDRAIARHVVANGRVRFVFCSPVRSGRLHGRSNNEEALADRDRKLVAEMHAHQEQHGDAVKDVAFEVDDARAVYVRAVQRGAVGVAEPRVLDGGVDGQVVVATVRTYGDTTHTFVEKGRYSGVFLPGFRRVERADPLTTVLPTCPLDVIDHCVGNQDWDQMEEACDL